MSAAQLFDPWPQAYSQWFQTPIGQVVLEVERTLVQELASPAPREFILDVGCGTGLFTQIMTNAGARAVGVDISLPMLQHAQQQVAGACFAPVLADMRQLPFGHALFDKAVSITAIEFISDAAAAVAELLRVTRPGGTVVVATLNRVGAWAQRRRERAQSDPTSIFRQAFMRTPEELLALSALPGIVRTAVHFDPQDTPTAALQREAWSRSRNAIGGAFVAARWRKPD